MLFWGLDACCLLLVGVGGLLFWVLCIWLVVVCLFVGLGISGWLVFSYLAYVASVVCSLLIWLACRCLLAYCLRVCVGFRVVLIVCYWIVGFAYGFGFEYVVT